MLVTAKKDGYCSKCCFPIMTGEAYSWLDKKAYCTECEQVTEQVTEQVIALSAELTRTVDPTCPVCKGLLDGFGWCRDWDCVIREHAKPKINKIVEEVEFAL